MTVNSSEIREHMDVVGSDGAHVGTVDRIEGSQIKLTKSDSPSDKHRFIAMEGVKAVENGKVVLNKTGAQAFTEEGAREIR
jgi:hypothetical protein